MSLEVAIEVDPLLATAHYNLGNARQAEQQLDRARSCCETAL